ncbi:MAG TPA: hypothetical protein VM286_06165 [Candidatus Thermoplasmatota archaeon]|nr:hypothetical protein [Candidatus Thermoplasmatota archaeon]
MASERSILESSLRDELGTGRLDFLGRRRRRARCYHLLRAEGVSRKRASHLVKGLKVAAKRLQAARELKEREIGTALDLILA